MIQASKAQAQQFGGTPFIMYDPIKDGMRKHSGNVEYRESKPPEALKDIVHNYWQIKSSEALPNSFVLHAIPDACTNILLNQIETDIAGITALKTTYTELDLGTHFNYAGIQLFPGVWQHNTVATNDGFVGSAYQGSLPLVDTNIRSASASFEDKLPIFTELVFSLLELGVINRNALIQKILFNLEQITSVSDMAEITHHSTRQLQRIIKHETGFSPHDFLKVMRMQQAMKQSSIDSFTDQSHFIRSFKLITGYTPTDYYQKYDV